MEDNHSDVRGPGFWLEHNPLTRLFLFVVQWQRLESAACLLLALSLAIYFGWPAWQHAVAPKDEATASRPQNSGEVATANLKRHDNRQASLSVDPAN